MFKNAYITHKINYYWLHRNPFDRAPFCILPRQSPCKEATARHIPDIPGWDIRNMSFNKTVHWRIEHVTPSLSWSERCHTSYLQHSGRQFSGSESVDYSIC